MLEKIIRDWGAEPRHRNRKHPITIEVQDGSSWEGFIVHLDRDTFTFESSAGRVRVPYQDVAIVSYVHGV